MKISDNVTNKYAQCWLAQYPWPQQCIHDPGGEFTGIEFQTLLEKCHIKDACTSKKIHNPMQYAKGCIKQLGMFYEHYYMVNHLKILQMQEIT